MNKCWSRVCVHDLSFLKQRGKLIIVSVQVAVLYYLYRTIYSAKITENAETVECASDHHGRGARVRHRGEYSSLGFNTRGFGFTIAVTLLAQDLGQAAV